MKSALKGRTPIESRCFLDVFLFAWPFLADDFVITGAAIEGGDLDVIRAAFTELLNHKRSNKYILMTKVSLTAIFTMQIIWFGKASAETIFLTCTYDDKSGQFSLEIDDNHVIKDGYLVVDVDSKAAKPTISNAFITWTTGVSNFKVDRKKGTYFSLNHYETRSMERPGMCEKTEGGPNKLSVDR